MARRIAAGGSRVGTELLTIPWLDTVLTGSGISQLLPAAVAASMSSFFSLGDAAASITSEREVETVETEEVSNFFVRESPFSESTFLSSSPDCTLR
jgi:hypothetical protein